MNTRKITQRWSSQDRQNFADRNFLRSATVPNKRREASRKACRGKNWE